MFVFYDLALHFLSFSSFNQNQNQDNSLGEQETTKNWYEKEKRVVNLNMVGIEQICTLATILNLILTY